ncbi:MAG: acetoacetate decarboxylase family protein [Caulobacteraceae bacterium]|nr:acetoacetate decarboxylase family protein [Caulobacteraceae bacterium]
MTGAPFLSMVGHGATALAPPGVFTGARANFFAFDADTAAMQALVDRFLNAAAAGAVRYQALIPVAMASFMDIDRCTSGTDVVGWLPGRETALWMILLESHPGDPLKDRLVFWAPYIFISYAIGMATGRESWGWPKTIADIAVAADNPAKPAFACVTTYFPTLAADTRGVTGPLYRIVPGAPSGQSPTPWTSARAMIADLTSRFLGAVDGALVDRLGLEPVIPSVTLKQFRDTARPDQACYQAICDSPLVVTGFSGAAPDFDPYTLQITTCASHAIAPDFLGRAGDPGVTTVPIHFSLSLDFDFQATAGNNIVVR